MSLYLKDLGYQNIVEFVNFAFSKDAPNSFGSSKPGNKSAKKNYETGRMQYVKYMT